MQGCSKLLDPFQKCCLRYCALTSPCIRRAHGSKRVGGPKAADAPEIFVVLVGKLVVVLIAGTVLSRAILFSPPKDMPLPIFMFLGSSVYRAEEGAQELRDRPSREFSSLASSIPQG